MKLSIQKFSLCFLNTSSSKTIIIENRTMSDLGHRNEQLLVNLILYILSLLCLFKQNIMCNGF